jgi:hypothetical protein
MTAREAYARLVYEDAAMQGLGFIQDRVWASNAVDTPAPRDNPFIVINVDLQESVFGTVSKDTVSYWVHMPREMGLDYSIIDLALEQIKALVTNVTHLAGSDGWSLTGGKWIDTSRDLVDEAFNTLVRYSTFTAATRSLVTP